MSSSSHCRNPFADLEPRKGKWRVVTTEELERHPDVAAEVYELIDTAYGPIGGHLKIRSPDDLLVEVDYFDLVDVDDDPKADAALLGKRRRGVKHTALGHDASRSAKRELLRHQHDELRRPGQYSEVSGRLAELLLADSVPVIEDQDTVASVLGKPIRWIGEVPEYPGIDGWYERKIGDHVERKVMVGMPIANPRRSRSTMAKRKSSSNGDVAAFRRREKFFYDNAGFSYDPKTQTEAEGRKETAKRLAVAEAWAQDADYTFDWEDEQESWDTFLGEFEDPEEIASVEYVMMKDPDGKVVQSLGGIAFAKGEDHRQTRRVFEAELAAEQFQEVFGKYGAGIETNPAKCPRGYVRIDRKGFTRKAFTDRRGRKVKATKVPRSTFCVRDRGRPGKTSFGAESGPRKGTKPLIESEGKLGGAGYTRKSAAERHRLLTRCVKRDGYRSCLGRLQVLLLSTELKPATRRVFEADKQWLVKTHGGEGSFGPRRSRRKSSRRQNPAIYFVETLVREGIAVELSDEDLAELEAYGEDAMNGASNGQWSNGVTQENPQHTARLLASGRSR